MVILIKHFTFDENKSYMEVLEEQFRIAIVSIEFKSIQKSLNHNYKNRNERRLMPDVCLGLAYIYWRTMRVVY